LSVESVIRVEKCDYRNRTLEFKVDSSRGLSGVKDMVLGSRVAKLGGFHHRY